uniref:Hexosyltransferase n=1 Tax=Strigamia maritima TaxID=126957 RepID=T1JN38_STRMM
MNKVKVTTRRMNLSKCNIVISGKYENEGDKKTFWQKYHHYFTDFTLWCFHSCDSLVCSEKNCKIILQKKTLNPAFAKPLNILTSNEIEYPLLVVLIFSSVFNMEHRDTIRQTWLKNSGIEIIHFFAIGSAKLGPSEEKTLQSENARFGDLLLLPDVVDDDSFVQLNLLFKELDSLKEKDRLYWGYFDGRASVKHQGHWKEVDWILCDHYLPYALGGGYVVSRDLVEYIYVNEKLLKLYKSEDVSLGTWLAPLDIRRIHDPRFDTEFKSRGCLNSYIVTHKQNIDEMRRKFGLFEERGKICNVELQHRFPYQYDWKVPPSKCCNRT